MKTKIVVDSSSNLYTLSGVDFVCVPLKIVTDDGEYLDTAELDAVGMAQTLRSYKGKTGTSCPQCGRLAGGLRGRGGSVRGHHHGHAVRQL